MGFLLILGSMFGGAVVISWLSDLARARKEADLQHQLNIVKLAFEKEAVDKAVTVKELNRCICGAPLGACDDE